METSLVLWLQKFEVALSPTYPILLWLSGWPAFSQQQTFLDSISVAQHHCLSWWKTLPHAKTITFSFQAFIQVVLLATQLACHHLRDATMSPAGVIKRLGTQDAGVRYLALQVLNVTDAQYECELRTKKKAAQLWESFITGPVALLVGEPPPHRVLTVAARRQRRAGKNSTSGPHLSGVQSQAALDNPNKHPTLLFLPSTELFMYKIPWDALPSLETENITLGIDLHLIFASYNRLITTPEDSCTLGSNFFLRHS